MRVMTLGAVTSPSFASRGLPGILAAVLGGRTPRVTNSTWGEDNTLRTQFEGGGEVPSYDDLQRGIRYGIPLAVIGGAVVGWTAGYLLWGKR